MKLLPSLAFAVAALLSACSQRDTGSSLSEVSRVEVLDQSHKQVLVIEQESKLKEFETHWSTKRSTGRTSEGTVATDFQYYLDVHAKAGGGRWIYSRAGLVAKLDPLAQPLYQVAAPEDFNRLLGIAK
jgi:hypothetical protein